MYVEISHYRTGTTNTHGSIDADVTVHNDAGEVIAEGEITLLRNPASGRWSSFGSPDHWIDSALLRDLLDGDLATDLRDILRDILAAVNQAEANSVQPEVSRERIEYDPWAPGWRSW